MKKGSEFSILDTSKSVDNSKKVGRILLTIVITLTLIFSIVVISASFTKGNPNHKIDSTYGKSQSIKGWINISLTGEPANSVINDSRGNNISLIDLLKKNSSNVYSCNPLDCQTAYSVSNGQTLKSFLLNLGNSKVYGLKLTGDINSVNSVSFDVQSDAPISCTSQVEVDFLDDGVTDFINNKSVAGVGCSNIINYGCFNGEGDIEELEVGTTPYCQKMNLTQSPSFAIGAFVKKVSGFKNISMSLYDNNGNEVASCKLLSFDATTTGSEISCGVNYSVTTPGSYSVCIYSINGTGTYRIRGNSAPVVGCGYYGLSNQDETSAAYQIFSEGKKFDAPGTIQMSNTLANGETLGGMVEEYIQQRYGGLNCINGCVVPIRIKSGVNQNIDLKNLNLNYEKTTGVVTENKFFDLVGVSANVSTSGFKKIDISSAGFTVPASLGDYNFALSLNNTNIFSEKVRVEDIPFITSINPLSTAALFPTNFTVKSNSSANITKFFWDFGDSKTDVTTKGTTNHTYSVVGVYNVTVTITDTRFLTSSKTFEINVSSPKDLLKSRIDSLKQSVSSIQSTLISLSDFSQQSVDSVLNLQETSTALTNLQTAYNVASTDADYGVLVGELLKIKIPKSIEESKKANGISFFSEKDNINMGLLQSISGGNYDTNNEDGYRNAIILWSQENIDVHVDFTEVSGDYGVFVEPIVRVFEISISEKNQISGSYFLIMPKLDNLEFAPGTVTTDSGDFVYVDLGRSQNKGTISFHTTANVDFANLPAFIAPGINSLSVTELVEPPKKTNSRFVVLILAIGVLLAVALVFYLILQQWYKRKYEGYLFKNRNDLYNMVTYVNSAKKKGLKNSEIGEHLRKAKWTSEQVSYVMKKYAGKRTGMFELPFFGGSKE